MKVICLNGPPLSGKDTVGRILVERHGYVPVKFAQPLIYGHCLVTGLPLEAFEQAKREDSTVRPAVIEKSEYEIKPAFGTEVFGLMAVTPVLQALARPDRPGVVVTDCGFEEELRGFATMLRIFYHEIEVELWRITRPQCTFEGDSRGFIDPRSVAVDRFLTLVNPIGLDGVSGSLGGSGGPLEELADLVGIYADPANIANIDTGQAKP